MRKKVNRGRKDHYVPQGYLRGFIDPARSSLPKPLWHFDVETGVWTEKSTSEVGWERGFYDYADVQTEQVHPDLVFAKYEREFPLVRDHILRRRYKGWVKQHRGFLLAYMQMMRARSPLFIEHQTQQNRNLRGATVTSVGPGNRITVDSLELRPFPENVVRNGVINQMQQEIRKGPDWMWDFNWCLRYTNDPSHPFVTGPQPLVIEGPAPNTADALRHPETTVWFPLCWQACLIGSLRRFDEGTYEAHPTLLHHARKMFARIPTGYVISPSKIDLV